MKRQTGKRILMLLENCTFPQDARVRHEAGTLVEAGCEVTLICPGKNGQPWREHVQGVHVLRYPGVASGDGLLGYVWEYGYSTVAATLLSMLAFLGRGFDVIHAHNPPDLFVLIAAIYKPFGKRFVFDHHDLSPEMYYARFEGKGNRWVYRALVLFEWLSCKMADHVIATNESYKTIEQQRHGIPADRITVVRNGPVPERFKAAAPDPELRKKASTIIGFVGVMGYQDGVDYLLRSVRRLIDDLGRTDVYCALLGTGDAYEDLKRLVVELDLEDHVWLPGFVSDEVLRSTLATADIMAAPDPRNAFTDRSTMIKVMEYMTMAKPIVAFDLTEHRVTAQGAALYAEANDTLDFARQIARLMDDPELRRRMGALGRRRIESELAWSHQKKDVLAAYAKLGVPVRRASEDSGEHAAATGSRSTLPISGRHGEDVPQQAGS